MDNLQAIDLCYKKYTRDLGSWLPDGLIQVDLNFLQELQILNFHSPQGDSGFTRYFQVIESEEKITLVNDQFIVWIVPEKIDDVTTGTLILIALNQKEEPHLEMAFSVTGVYNTSKLVLRILERLLEVIQDNEEAIRDLK